MKIHTQSTHTHSIHLLTLSFKCTYQLKIRKACRYVHMHIHSNILLDRFTHICHYDKRSKTDGIKRASDASLQGCLNKKNYKKKRKKEKKEKKEIQCTTHISMCTVSNHWATQIITWQSCRGKDVSCIDMHWNEARLDLLSFSFFTYFS